MKVAIIGAKGYPYVYGGYDTFVKELAERLITKNIAVTIYCHKKLFSQRPKQVNGINLKYITAIETKSLSQLTHSFLSFINACFSDADIILTVNSANGPFGLLTKLFRKKTIINVDGLEWKRPKWKGLGSKYFWLASWLSTKLFDQIVTDAEEMQKIYLDTFNCHSTVIAYGANECTAKKTGILERLSIQAREYYLIIGRLIPDNNADILIEGFSNAKSHKKLVIVGDVSYKDAYAQKIKDLQTKNIIMAGYITDNSELLELYQNCFAYIHGHEFGGTNPTLIQALACNCAILALDTPFSKEMLSNYRFGLSFQKETASVAAQMQYLENNPEEAQKLRLQSVNGISAKYTWDAITHQYIQLMNGLITRKNKL